MIPFLIDPYMAVANVNDDIAMLTNASLVSQKVMEASAMVMKHLKLAEFPDAWAEDLDASPVQYIVPFDIQAATYLVFGTLWQFREGAQPSSFREANPMSDAVKNLLRGYRDPTLA